MLIAYMNFRIYFPIFLLLLFKNLGIRWEEGPKSNQIGP